MKIKSISIAYKKEVYCLRLPYSPSQAELGRENREALLGIKDISK